jgi:hypothetical protein
MVASASACWLVVKAFVSLVVTESEPQLFQLSFVHSDSRLVGDVSALPQTPSTTH